HRLTVALTRGRRGRLFPVDLERMADGPGPNRAAWWPHLRAALIALHVVAIIVLSFPGSGKLDQRWRWKQPRAQHEIKAWGQKFRDWGLFEGSDPEFEEALWALAQRYVHTRNAIVAPFQPYGTYAGANQGWGMFKAPARTPHSLSLSVVTDEGETTVYRSRSSTETFLRRQLDNNRFRKIVGRAGRQRAVFDQLGQWMAGRVWPAYPEARAAVVRIHRHEVLEAEDIRAGLERPSAVKWERRFRRPGAAAR
ncbi:MAG: hypothetical protein AAGA56_25745, partial [Myxococcota bacterium]